MKHLIPLTLMAALLTGCGKNEVTPVTRPEASSETKPGANIVTLTLENLQHISLKTEPAALGSLGMTLKAVGRISANLNQTAKVAPTLEGRLTKLNFDLNDHVKTGDVLGLVESPELLGKALELKAPIDGVITERNATVGELVDKAKPVYTISDPTQLWAIAEVKERDIAAVKLGQDAVFTVLAYLDVLVRGPGGERLAEIPVKFFPNPIPFSRFSPGQAIYTLRLSEISPAGSTILVAVDGTGINDCKLASTTH